LNRTTGRPFKAFATSVGCFDESDCTAALLFPD
jgi:hypothetical protein